MILSGLFLYALVVISGMAVLCACLYLVKKLSVGGKWVLSIPILFFLIFGFMEVFGNLLLFDTGQLSSLVSRDWIVRYLEKLRFTSAGRWRAVFSFNLSMACITFGVWLASKVKKFDPDAEVERYVLAPLSRETPLVVKVFIGLYAVSVAVSVFYFMWGGGFPVLHGITAFLRTGDWKASYNILENERLVLTYAGGGRIWGQSYFEQFRSALLPYTAGFLLFYGINYKKNKTQIFPGVFAFLVAFFLLFASGQRHPLVRFLISLFASLTFLVHFPKKKIAVISASAILIIAAIAILPTFLGTLDKNNNFRNKIRTTFQGAIVEHIFLGNSVDARQAFELFPEKFPFQRGRTWLISFLSFLPRSHGGFSVEYYNMIYSESAIDSVHAARRTGSSPATITGESYINFGFAGVVIISVLAGFVMQMLHIYFVRLRPKTILDVVTVGFTGMGLAYAWGFGNLLSFVPMGVFLFIVCWAAGRFLMRQGTKAGANAG